MSCNKELALKGHNSSENKDNFRLQNFFTFIDTRLGSCTFLEININVFLLSISPILCF